MTPAKLEEKSNQSLKSKDTVAAYLHEIGRLPMLSPDEEIIYAKQVQRMMSCLEVKEKLEQQTQILLDNQEWAEAVGLSEKELKQVLYQGKRAKAQMIQGNLRLVVSVAKKYLNRNMEFLDLIQEGSLGLEKAAEKFDHTKGYKFSTYSYWWIRQGITNAINTQARTIRLPIHITKKLNKIKKIQRELALKLGRSATTREVAQEIGITSDEIREYIRKTRQPISMNMKVGKTKDSELSELIQDSSPSLFNQLTHSLLKEDLAKMLLELQPKEQEVISLRFGLKDGEELTLGAIGQRLNVSRERVRQLQNRALLKLKNQNPGALRAYLVG